MNEARLQSDIFQLQVQTQKMSQRQIMSLQILAYSNADLRGKIYEEVRKNPALEIIKDDFALGTTKSASEKTLFSDNIRYASVSDKGQVASDIFQAALESSADTSVTLQDHLEHQFLSRKRAKSEESLGLKLIHNLNDKGFHILAPVSLLDKNDPNQNEDLLNKCIEEIRNLDPVGCCCVNPEESLLCQAKMSADCPEAALFFLRNRLSLLDPPVLSKIMKKLRSLEEEQKKLSFAEDFPQFSEDDVSNALDFIKTLDPFPARNFGVSRNRYIFPDVYVSKRALDSQNLDRDFSPESNEIVSTDGKFVFSVEAAFDNLPQLSVSSDFENLSQKRIRIVKSTEKSERIRAEHRFAKQSVDEAKLFIKDISFRQTTILKVCAQIVRAQIAFFQNGPMFLSPLRQNDIAEAIGVHETTVSRAANGKFIQCEWGLFEICYFFSGAIKTTESFKSETALSKNSVMQTIKLIFEEHKNDEKPLSDQKLTDILAEKGIKIARRTVAKYRKQMNIDSSFRR